MRLYPRVPSFRRCCSAVAAGQSLLLVACAHNPAPPQVTSTSPLIPAPTAQEIPPAQDGYLVVSEQLQLICSVPDTSSDSPQFDFDAASLRPRGMGILDQIALCMREGSLSGHGVTIIGHTDPRGSDQYNLKLGMERANATRQYLAQQGVALSAVTVRSRGEQDSKGDDKSAWQLDRRVEIEQTPEISR